MGVGNLLIGENQGAAQLFGHNPAIQQFGEMLAQRKAKQEQDNKVLNDYLSTSYDPGSLRNEADKTVYLKKYQDIKQQAIDAENERDETKKALKISEIRQQIGNLSAYAEGSKKQGLFERGSAAVELGKNPDHYEDESVKRFKDGLEKNWDDPNIIKNFSDIERRVDPNKLQAEYEKYKKDNIEPTQWGNPVQTSVLSFDGKKKAIFQQNRGVPIDGDNGAYETFLHKVTADPNWKKGLKDMYPDVNTGNPQADLALRARKYMHDQGDVKGWFDKPKETPMEGEAPQRWSPLQQWNFAHYGNPNSPSATAANEPTPSQTLITGMKGGQPGSGEKFISLAPPGQYGKETPHIGYDEATGEQIFSFPAHVDQKAVEYNKAIKEKWQKNNPGMNFDTDFNPDDKKYGKLKPETNYPAVINKRLNPASPNYIADLAELAKTQNINLNQLDKIEGKKSGHGQIDEAKIKAGGNKQEKTVPTAQLDNLSKKWGLSRENTIKYLKEQGYTVK